MCLEAGHKKIEPTTLIQSGWKKFDGAGIALRFEAYSYKGGKDVPLDQWIVAEGKEVSASPNYPVGFHIYEDETNKRGHHRVYYRKAHTWGKQDGCTIVVASEMYVPSIPDKWPPRP